jgi:hypothetical protein
MDEIRQLFGKPFRPIVFDAGQPLLPGAEAQPIVQKVALPDRFHDGWFCAFKIQGTDRSCRTDAGLKTGVSWKFSMKDM